MREKSFGSIGQPYFSETTSATSTAPTDGGEDRTQAAPSLALTSSAAGFPAKTSPTPGSGPELTAPGPVCGPNSTASSTSSPRSGSSSKTSPPFGAVVSIASSGTLPRAGMMRSGIVFERPSSGRPTAANASSLLPTLATREWKDASRGEVLARLDRGDGVAKRICALSQTLPSSAEIVGLHPSFAEWHMGFPTGWGELGERGTPSSPKLPNSSVD